MLCLSGGFAAADASQAYVAEIRQIRNFRDSLRIPAPTIMLTHC
jgi:hypothetical protein